MTRTSWAAVAARNNAEWCDVIARAHGAPAHFDADAWTSRTRTPVGYPDAVTLQPSPSLPELLARIDTSPGCSIKDSFASLELAAYGFRLLFDAQWIVRPADAGVPPTAERWEVVRTAAQLEAWEQAWRGDGTVPSGLFRAELLDRADVAVLATYAGGRVVGGAILNRSTTVVGISNLFVDATRATAGWPGCLALASSLFPGSPFVGYEHGEELASARRHGFEVAGSLRVWMLEG